MSAEHPAAQIPELVKLAASAAQNDPDGSSAELVKAWKALVAENRELRQAAQEFIACGPDYGGQFEEDRVAYIEAFDAAYARLKAVSRV